MVSELRQCCATGVGTGTVSHLYRSVQTKQTRLSPCGHPSHSSSTTFLGELSLVSYSHRLAQPGEESAKLPPAQMAVAGLSLFSCSYLDDAVSGRSTASGFHGPQNRNRKQRQLPGTQQGLRRQSAAGTGPGSNHRPAQFT